MENEDVWNLLDGKKIPQFLGSFVERWHFCWDSHAIPGLCGQREEASTRTSLGQEAKLGDMFKACDTMPSKKKIVLTFAEKDVSLSF